MYYTTQKTLINTYIILHLPDTKLCNTGDGSLCYLLRISIWRRFAVCRGTLTTRRTKCYAFRYPSAHLSPKKQFTELFCFTRLPPLGFKSFLYIVYKIKRSTRFRCTPFYFCLWGTKKIFLSFLRMNSNSYINHGESRVYHQFRRNCISSKRSFVYHHCEKKCSLRLMIYTFGDEMHAIAWWYTIAFAMDKWM